MSESCCLMCCNTNCDLYWDIAHGRDDPADYLNDCPNMVWPGDVSASDPEGT